LGILRDPLGPPGYRGDINCWRITRTEKNWSIIFSRTEHKSFMVHPSRQTRATGIIHHTTRWQHCILF